MSWLILADDLSGATDCGAAFARAGWNAQAFWTERVPGPDVRVWAHDAATRYLSAEQAASRHRDAALRWLTPGRHLYKKMDSTLRGQPAAEVAALAATLRELGRPDWCVCAPAHPSARRTTRDGHVFVDGVPLERTATWAAECSHASADLADLFTGMKLHPEVLPLDCVRSEPVLLAALADAATQAARMPGTVVICDAQSVADLDRIASAARGVRAPGFFAGSAGLAQALAAQDRGARAQSPALPSCPRGTLVVVGSMATVSLAAARRLAARPDVNCTTLEPGSRAPRDDIAALLDAGDDVLVMLEPGTQPVIAPRPELVRDAAAALAPALKSMGALIVTGGESAAALLAQCYVDGIRLIDEIEPGLALGITRGALEVPIVTKPGAFGDAGSLERCLEHLNGLRRNA